MTARGLVEKHMRKVIILGAMITMLALVVMPARALLSGGVGTIRIEPHGSYYGEPIMLSSPATFSISVMPSADPTCDPHIFLVMTNTSYQALTGVVTVEWTGDGVADLNITTWTMETDNGVKVPPGAVEGASYTVASLRDHLDTSEAIYWAFESFLGAGAYLTQVPQEFTVTLPSTEPRMLVYALGKIGYYSCSTGTGERPLGLLDCPVCPTGLFDNNVPPTMPGFVVPEPSTALLAVASFSAFALYAFKRRRV
jgi:hypothetical protein